MRQPKWAVALVVVLLLQGTARAQVSYLLDDGTPEGGLILPQTGDHIFLNQFPVAPGGEVITNVSIAFGFPSSFNGSPTTITVYQDADGGSTTNAVLLTSFAAVITNAGSFAFENFNIPDTAVSGNFLVGFISRNIPNLGFSNFPVAADLSDPSFPGRSYSGRSAGVLNENDLSSLGASYQSFDSGNWMIRADGIAPIPEPASMTLMGLAVAGYGVRRFKKKK